MNKVIERINYDVDINGCVHYDDITSSYEDAEKICGYKLNRRKNYAIIDGQVCELLNYTIACSGCHEENLDDAIGNGCNECGYTGRLRIKEWVKIITT